VVELAWIDEHLPTARTGPLKVFRDRPWSMVARVPTVAGAVYVKENRGDTRYEAALVRALAGWVPDRVLMPIAVDVRRGWTLLPDGGPILREIAGTEPDHWERLLADHARLQRDLAPRVDELHALGVPDHRPAAFAANLTRLAASDALIAELPALRDHNECLRQGGIPMSLQHDDLHDGNVFGDGRVFDWGDASVGHPFGVLLVSLRVAADRFQVPDGDPLVLRLRDAYLEPWSDLADRESLLAQVRAAVQLAKVGRALAWQRALAGADAAALVEWGDSVAGWLDELRTPVTL
jgi:Phosphotransferase enzyme family